MRVRKDSRIHSFGLLDIGRLDVKALSKSSRRKEYLYIIYILYISIKYINN